MQIRVDEGEDVDLTFRLKRRLPGGGTDPLIITGATEIQLVVKEKLADADASAKFTYKKTTNDITVTSDGSLPGAEYAEIVVKTKGVDQTPPGHYYFHLDVTKGGRREVIDKDVWTIENI